MPKITIETSENTFEIEVKSGASLRDAVTAVIDAPEIKAILEKEAEESYFEAYRNDGSVYKEWNEQAAKAFIDGGKDGLEDWIVTENEYRIDQEIHSDVEKIKADSDIEELVDAIVDGLKDARRNKASEIRAMVDEVLSDTLTSLIEDGDNSKPLDLITDRDEVLLTYIPGKVGMLAAEDIHTRATDRVHSVETVMPDERLIPFFKLINLSKDAFLAHCREQGIDLTGRLVAEGVSEYRVKDDADRAQLWKDAAWEIDPSRPALLSPAEAVEVLDNAGYGGVPSLTVKVPLKWFVERDWSQGMVIEPRSLLDGGKTRTIAGQIGIHDFVNGSGHTVSNDQPVIIPPCERNEFVVSDQYGCGFDSVYDFVGWALTAGKFSDTPVPEPKNVDEAMPGMRV